MQMASSCHGGRLIGRSSFEDLQLVHDTKGPITLAIHAHDLHLGNLSHLESPPGDVEQGILCMELLAVQRQALSGRKWHPAIVLALGALAGVIAPGE